MLLRLLYTLLWHLAIPLIGLRLAWRARRQPEYLQHVEERFGRYPCNMDGPLIWLHAVSVGETRASAPLVHALLDAHPECSLLLTHMTPTGRATAAELFGGMAPRVRSVYLPYDLPWAVARFLRHFRPRMGVLMETELWPNLVEGCRHSGIPLALVNARLSERSARGYGHAGSLARDAVAHLSAIGAQTEADGQRLTALGARWLQVTGNIKFDITPPDALLALGKAFRSRIGPRPILLAASTREGEEGPLLEAFARRCPAEVLLVLVPRHPQRFDEVAGLVARSGLKQQRRSDDAATVSADTRVLLGDSMGEMYAYYAASDVALIGGSWEKLGGQNPIEAAAVGCPVVVGPHTFNFKAVCEQAIDAGAALRAENLEEGVDLALDLIRTPARRQAMGEAGQGFARAHRGATARTIALLDPLLRGAPARKG
ncbi:lipid IV(A) 3-deoxy-D-manno-octulosonic acid transferase [Zoogloea sp.]|uniref:lipid IV(A) 3-deoxy-D-manno-octulosonic acid transferase n=1 Tax=Zoogloea sp. TaxID=49181 RepID=UPI0035B42495